MNVPIVFLYLLSMATAFTVQPDTSPLINSARFGIPSDYTPDLAPEWEPVAPKLLDRAEDATRKRVFYRQGSRLEDEQWQVRIYNDGTNTREHVAQCLVRVTGATELNAYETMMDAHKNGIAVVGSWIFEIAEAYQEGLKTNGIISDFVPADFE